MKVVIIGGGSAGTTCAFELRKLNKEVEITLIEKSSNVEYSPCALPYVLSGEIKSLKDIFIFGRNDYESNGINLILNSEVVSIDRKNKKIFYKKQDSKEQEQIDYDKLVISTGSFCFFPEIEGIDKTDFFKLKTIQDAEKILKSLKKKSNSVIVGGGMIGLELAFSLKEKGENVSVVETRENILPHLVDSDISQKLKDYLEDEKIKFYENKTIEKVSNKELFLKDEKIKFDKLFLCTGVRADIRLAKESGLKTNQGIIVNEYLQTSDKDIYSCGDCTEAFEFFSGKKILSQLGTTAVRQAKIIAKNITGKKEKFSPVLKNTITKIGKIYFGSVGLTEKKAMEYQIKTISAKYSGNVRSDYYPSKSKITIKIVCDKKGRVIGSQIIGDEEVVGRMDLLALAITKKLNIRELANLETCYNPPSAPIFDPLTIAAEICVKKLNLD